MCCSNQCNFWHILVLIGGADKLRWWLLTFTGDVPLGLLGVANAYTLWYIRAGILFLTLIIHLALLTLNSEAQQWFHTCLKRKKKNIFLCILCVSFISCVFELDGLDREYCVLPELNWNLVPSPCLNRPGSRSSTSAAQRSNCCSLSVSGSVQPEYCFAPKTNATELTMQYTSISVCVCNMLYINIFRNSFASVRSQ